MSPKLPPKKKPGGAPVAGQPGQSSDGAPKPASPAPMPPKAAAVSGTPATPAAPGAPRAFSSPSRPAGAPKPAGRPAPQVQKLSKPVPFGSQKAQVKDPNSQKLQKQAQAKAIEKKAPIERRAAALPGVTPADSKLFELFIETVSPKLEVKKTSAGVLDAFSSIDVKAEKVGAILGANPYYETIFMKVIDSLGSKRENVKPESAVILLGMQNSRNLIIALQMLRSMTSNPPEWTKEGKLKANPSDVLKFALKTEESLANGKQAYADTAYAGGYVFDLVTQICETLSQDKKKVAPYIEQIYNHGVKTAQVAIELVRKLPDFNYIKYAYSASLIHDIGKALMAIVDPTYLDFAEKCQQKGIPRQIRFFAETQRFGINHAVMGALCCEFTQIFRPVSKAVLYHHDPHLLYSQKSQWQLASVIALASNIASNFKKTNDPEDPITLSWKTPELKGFNLEMRAILEAVGRVP